MDSHKAELPEQKVFPPLPPKKTLPETIAVTYPSETRGERIADAIVHALSLVAIAVAGIVLMASVAMHAAAGVIAACAIYVGGLTASFAASAGYHLLPWHEWRQRLRRLDHVAIYALIAGTFTPLLVHVGTPWALIVLSAIWALALPAMVYKVVGREIEPRWSLASYLGLGWLGALATPEFGAHLTTTAIIAIFLGGLVYTAGTFFYARKVQAYRHAIWHSFVLAGTAFLFVAVWSTVFSGVSVAG